MKCQFCKNEIPNESVFCPICGKQVSVEEEEKSSGPLVWAFAIISITLFIVVACIANNSTKKDEQISELQKQIGEVEEVTAKAEELEAMIDDIAKAFSETPPITYYEDNFQINEGTVVLKEGGTSYVLELTAWWWNDADVTIESSDSKVVSVLTDFAEDNKTADITLTPHSAGVATITVSTTRYDKILRVIVVVQP